jgi:hypothetical protein
MASQAVGHGKSPAFKMTQIVASQANLQAWKCPCFVQGVSLLDIQFGASVIGQVVNSIRMERGRCIDPVFRARMNAHYHPPNTLDLNGYHSAQGMSQGKNMLGHKAVSGRLINFINDEQFNNLLTNNRFSNWFFNDNKPLALDYAMPALDQYFNSQGMPFIKLADQGPLSNCALLFAP